MIATAILICASIAVIDGDTIHCDAETVRIATIDAPELRTAKCDAEHRLAEVARDRLAEMLAAGRVTVKPGDPASHRLRDKYGRMLGVVSVDGRDVGEILIRERLARRWNRPTPAATRSMS